VKAACRSSRASAGLMAVLFVLTGCASDRDNAGPVSAAPAAVPQIAAVPAPNVPAPTSPPTSPRYPALDSLAGQPSSQIESLLGTPKFRRRDKPAELWQYRSGECVLNLFLYPGIDRGLRVDHLEIHDRNGGSPERQACFVTLLKAKAARKSG